MERVLNQVIEGLKKENQEAIVMVIQKGTKPSEARVIEEVSAIKSMSIRPHMAIFKAGDEKSSLSVLLDNALDRDMDTDGLATVKVIVQWLEEVLEEIEDENEVLVSVDWGAKYDAYDAVENLATSSTGQGIVYLVTDKPSLPESLN